MKKSEVYKLKHQKKDTNHKGHVKPQVELVALTNPDMTYLIMVDRNMPEEFRGELLITVLSYTLKISRQEAIDQLTKESDKKLILDTDKKLFYPNEQS